MIRQNPTGSPPLYLLQGLNVFGLDKDSKDQGPESHGFDRALKKTALNKV